MSEEPMATVGVVPVYESEFRRMLDEFGIKTTVVYGPQPSNEMLMKRSLEQLALTTRYDYAYWQARYDQLVLSAMLSAYIETGEVVVSGLAPPIDRHLMMVHTLAEAGYLVAGIDVADTRIDIHLPPSGEMGPAFDAGIAWDILAAPPEMKRAQPDYLRHDPTKQVHRRRPRKAYGRKGDRP